MILMKNNYPTTINLLDSLFNNIFDEETSTKVPVHDIIENDDNYQIETLLAGVKKDDININIDDDTLSITAERKETDGIRYNRKQSFFGKYERLFKLPDDVDIDNIVANHEDGILKIKIPKLESKIPKKQKIEIT